MKKHREIWDREIGEGIEVFIRKLILQAIESETEIVGQTEHYGDIIISVPKLIDLVLKDIGNTKIGA